MLLEALSSDPDSFCEDILAWRPPTVRNAFSCPVSAIRTSPPRAASHSARFDEAVARLHGEALTLVAHVGGVLDP